MINVLLCCASGMSTSLLVEKMQRAANEKGIDVHIWAVNANEISEQVKKADVVLLGPQARYARDQIIKFVGDTPCELISMRDYGMMDGESVLEHALSLIQ
jgi:PTS system cellobiose-specific IIB component